MNQWKTQLREAASGVFELPSARRGGEAVKDAELFEQIGRLKMELEWLKSSVDSTCSLRSLIGTRP